MAKASKRAAKRPAAAALSPLAPKRFARSAAFGRGRLGDRHGGRQIQATAPMFCWPRWRRAPRWPGSSPSPRPPSAPVEWCRTPLASGAGPGPWWSTAAMPMPLPAKRAGRGARRWRTRPLRRSAAGLGGVSGLDRGDRRAAAGRKNHRNFSRSWRDEAAHRGWRDAGRSHHDHRHLSQAAPPPRPLSTARKVHDQRHRQGLGHDRARHGDHAGLRVHRCRRFPRRCCRTAAERGVEPSFNAITVDGDTSTSDTLLLFATGKGARHARVPADRQAAARFPQALDAVLLDLAQQWSRTARAPRSSIRIDVTGARRMRRRARIALCIANSPLVKTAIAGDDANWGRVVMAVGKAGENGRPRQAQNRLWRACGRQERRAGAAL